MSVKKRRSWPFIYAIAGLAVLLALSGSISGQVSSDDVLRPIPKAQRQRFAERFKLLLLYEREQRWAEEYDLLSPIYLQGQSKEDFVKQLQDSDGGRAYVVLDFDATSIVLEAASSTAGQWVIIGCSKLRKNEQIKTLRSTVGVYWHDAEWYFSPVLVFSTIHDEPQACTGSALSCLDVGCYRCFCRFLGNSQICGCHFPNFLTHA